MKSKVVDYWENKLRLEASFLPSLPFFNPEYMSLTTTHLLWTSAGHNTYEVSKARIQLLFLSNQYPCAKVTRHWSHENPHGICSYLECQDKNLVESPEHILMSCPAYASARLCHIALSLRVKNKISHRLLFKFLISGSTHLFMQFLLNCSVIPEVIRCAQLGGQNIYDNLFYCSRTWCFAMHRERLIRLCKWNFR